MTATSSLTRSYDRFWGHRPQDSPLQNDRLVELACAYVNSLACCTSVAAAAFDSLGRAWIGAIGGLVLRGSGHVSIKYHD